MFGESSRFRATAACCAGLLALGLAVHAQEPVPVAPPTTPPATTPAPDTTQTPAATQAPADASQQPAAAPAAPTAASTVPAPEATAPAAKSAPSQEPGISEEELKQLLVGKPLYLRGGYLDSTLSFSEHGTLISHSPQGSYTLSAIEIDRVHLTKHKVELEGARYGLHFLGALPYEDPTKALDRVKITPKKKVVRITIDRELVVIPKKKKENEKPRELKAKAAAPASAAPATATDTASAAPVTSTDSTAAAPATTPNSEQAAQAATPAPSSTAPPSAAAPKEQSAEDEAKAEMAAAPAEERPADPTSVTTTISPAHAAKVLKDALDKIFAPGLDDRMMAAMPDFWKLYYQAVAAKDDYRPTDPSVLRQNTVDKKAELVTKFEPESNEWAQASGIAGPALYHAVIGADGKPTEIAVARPIGFGLDESAVEAIRKASFEPAIKDGKPVPVLLDLYVSFRIYSKRTSVSGKQEADNKNPVQPLPGPYTAQALRHQ
jgi:TonB family protein